MHDGMVLMLDNPVAVRKSLGIPMIELWTSDARSALAVARQAPGVKKVSMYGDKLHIALEQREAAWSIVETLAAEGIEVKGRREILPSLEDVFIAMVEK